MFEITLNGLNKRQQVLADILWSLEEWDDVERFIVKFNTAVLSQPTELVVMKE